MVLHLIPLSSIETPRSVDVSAIEPAHEGLVLLGSESHAGDRFNFDGRIVAHFPDEGSTARGYLQVFRTGMLEAVRPPPTLQQGHRQMLLSVVETMLIDSTLRYLGLLSSLEWDFPVAVMISLTGVEGCRGQPNTNNAILEHYCYPIDRDTLLLPQVAFGSLEDDVPTVLRPAFDVMWNASGLPRSMNYDPKSGEYQRE